VTKTTIIVPCYNEANRLDNAAFAQFFVNESQTQILFVDDGSRDNTVERLNDLQQKFPEKLEVLSLPTNQGKAEAVRRGMLQAMDQSCDFVGYWDADLATPLWEIPRFVTLLESRPEFDLAIGSRVQLLGRKIQRDTTRHYLGRIFATVASLVLGLPDYDTQCGAKLFRHTSESKQLFAKPFSSRWVFDVELIHRFTQLPSQVDKQGIVEVPLEQWIDIAGSKLRFWDAVQAGVDLLQLGADIHLRK